MVPKKQRRIEDVLSGFIKKKYVPRVVGELRRTWPGEIAFLASYPRSGNGWVRQLAVEAILEEEGLSFAEAQVLGFSPGRERRPSLQLPDGRAYGIEEIFPDLYCCDPPTYIDDVRVNRYVRHSGLLFKVHHLVGLDEMTKVSYLFRDPLRATTSFYNYKNNLCRAGENDKECPEHFNAILPTLLDGWQRMAEHYLHLSAHHSERVHFLCFEELEAGLSEKLVGLLRHFSVEVSAVKARTILKRSPHRSGFPDHLLSWWSDENRERAQLARRSYDLLYARA